MNNERRFSPERPRVFETEIRANLYPQQRSDIFKKLVGIEAEYKGYQKIIDTYYCPLRTTSFSDLEMNEVGSFSLRLRKITNQDNTSAYEWNIKQIVKKYDHSSWAEYETTVDSYDNADRMIKIMGNKPFITIEKIRHIHTLNKNGQEYKLLVEDIKNYGSILEIETFPTLNNVNNSKRDMHELLSSLEIEENQIVPKSVTNIIMREHSQF